jgi:hypothetical protein
MMMLFGHKYSRIERTKIFLCLFFILSIHCCSTVMDSVLLILFFLNSKGFGWFSKNTGFWWRNLRERNHLGDPGVDGRIILRWFFRKWDVGSWIGSSWLRIGTGGRHL